MESNLKRYAIKHHVPIIQDGGLEYLKELILKHHARHILELGTAIGYSALMMAALDPDIKIKSIERNFDMYNQALINVKNSNYANQIELVFSDIKDYQDEGLYDLIFVDAGKAHYYEYLMQFIDNLKPDGIMVFDNMIFHGMVYDVEKIKNRNTRQLVKKIINFYDKVKEDKHFIVELHKEIGDGILVLRRREDAL